MSYYSYDSLGNPWCAGGGALRDFEILRRQRETWREIAVITGAYPGSREEVRDGIRYRPLGWGRSYWLSRITFVLLANLRVLFDRADLIGNSVSSYAPLLAGLLRRGKFLIVAHHYVGRKSLEKFGRLIGGFAWACEWTLFRRCRHLIVSNGSLADRVRARNHKADLLVSQNGFDARLLEAPPEEAEPPFILFLGRFDIYMKGLDALVEAYGRVGPDLRRGTRLVLAGVASPKALAAVEKLVPPPLAGEVEILPNVSDEKKRELLRTCLFFCSPSRFEGWGIAALEANAAGKPVLVTDTDGFRDSIKAGYSGIMTPVGDSAALVDGFETLLRDGDLRRRMAGNAREWAVRFTWKEIADRERKWISSWLGK